MHRNFRRGGLLAVRARFVNQTLGVVSQHKEKEGAAPIAKPRPFVFTPPRWSRQQQQTSC